MVGRERELSTLTTALDDTVRAGRPGLVLVYGPAGIGKSRLLQEYGRAIAAADRAEDVPPRLVRARCLPVGSSLTYWPLAEALRSVATISLDEPAGSARSKLEAAVTAALGEGGSDPLTTATVHALALTAGIRIPDNALAEMEPAAAAEELGRAWPRFLSALAAKAPFVLAIEDLHWASDELLVMLERILRRSSGPLLVVATARPEFEQEHAGFAAGIENLARVSLRPLTTEQGTTLLNGLLADFDLPDRLRSEVLERVEGNPFFLEEIVRRMIDDGQLVHEGDQWRLTDPSAGVRLPDSVLSLLGARIDALPSSEKRVVQEASVIGRIFWEEPVRQLVGNGEVTAALERLEGRGLVSVRPTSSVHGQIEYIFKHALVRDVAYASLPRRRRARAHADVAAWTETLAGSRGDEFLDLIAHHYGEALLGDDADLAWEGAADRRERARQRAFEAFLAAGNAARQRYHATAAVERHTRALALAMDDEEQGRAHEALGDDHEVAFRGDEAWHHYKIVLNQARRRADDATIARVSLRMGSLGTKWGGFRNPPASEEVEAQIEEGLRAASAPDDLRARLLIEQANFDMFTLEHTPGGRRGAERAGRSLEEAADIARRIEDPDLEFAVEDARSTWHWTSQNRQSALQSLENSLRLLPAVRSRSAQAMGYFQASFGLRTWLADYDRALEVARRAYELGRGLSVHEMMHGTVGMMVPLYRLGRWAEIDPLLDEHLSLYAEEADRKCSSIRGGLALGAVLKAQRGQTDAAAELIDKVGDLSEDPTLADAIAIEGYLALGRDDVARRVAAWLTPERLGSPSHRTLAIVAAAVEVGMALQDWETTAALLPAARRLAVWEPTLAAAADRYEGRKVLVEGDAERGAELLRRAVASYEHLRTPFEEARTREFLADAVDGNERESLLRHALETYELLGAAPHVARVHAALR
jgi:hypothetical protein